MKNSTSAFAVDENLRTPTVGKPWASARPAEESMMPAFANQVVFITGAGSGIGRQLALALAAEGAAVVAVDLKPEPLEALGKDLGDARYAWAIADVTDITGLRSVVKDLERKIGPVDILIANAGIGRDTSALNFHAEDVEAQIKVNLIGVANSIDAVLPGMLARNRGHIVAMSSLASYRGLPKMSGYCAAKAGVNGLLEGMRIELRPKGIHVSIICPGWIRTPLTANIKVPQPYMMDVEYATRRIVDAIRAKKEFIAFPGPARRRMRLLRWLPSRLSDWLVVRVVRRMTAS
jgi:NAD(P)-dependent dehydrogenase (short-subunit alcohol dehydrogenase family)